MYLPFSLSYPLAFIVYFTSLFSSFFGAQRMSVVCETVAIKSKLAFREMLPDIYLIDEVQLSL